ncbi:MAG: hypothetical protein EON52_07735, partial [Actinomycetales bacterium]
MSTREGVSFARDSTSATGRAVLADALRKADPVGARAVEHETSWRRNYLEHFRRAVEAGIGDAAAARSVAAEGLRSATEQMRYDEVPLASAIETVPLEQALHTTTLQGGGSPDAEVSIPYRGERLRGAGLVRQLDEWVARGVITQSCSDAVQTVMTHPEWLRLEGDTVVVLGAGAEMGPYRALQRWGATVAALDLPRADVQQRVREVATAGAGRVLVPSRIVTDAGADEGADLVRELPAVADWLDRLADQTGDRLVLG